MYTIQPKKMLIINILDILKKYSDEDHRLSQKEIADILKTEYSMNVERKSIKRNLMDLIDFGYEIEYSESVRMIPNKSTGKLEESYVLSDFYLVRDFTNSELRLLIDSLLFSKHIPYSQRKELIGKLEGLSNQYFKSLVKHICTMTDLSVHNQQLFIPLKCWTKQSAKIGRYRSPIMNTAQIKKCIHEKTAAAIQENILLTLIK